MIKRESFYQYLCALSFYLTLLTTSAAQAFQVENFDSIEHFRVIPLLLESETNKSFIRHTVQDKEGYLWFSGTSGISKYDGYSLTRYELEYIEEDADVNGAYLFVNEQGQLFVGDSGLYVYDYETASFTFLNITEGKRVRSIFNDSEGFLWLAGQDFGLIQYDTTTNTVVNQYNNITHEGFPNFVWSAIFDKTTHSIWIADPAGIFRFDLNNKQLTAVPLSYSISFGDVSIRDMALDETQGLLWIGTQKGLLQIDTNNFSQRLFQHTETNLPTSHITTVLLDASNNLWVGLEKQGVCVYQASEENFLCLAPEINTEHKLPPATVEDIYEDNQGNLWLAMNHYGIHRLSPHLEKFQLMRDLFSSGVADYFPYSFDGVVKNNGDIWFATDGGGINIFNYLSGHFKNLKHDDNDVNSPSSDSIISLDEDENGNIWAGTWAGGMFKVNPETFEISRFKHDPTNNSETNLAGNNIFFVLSDKQGGIWASIWNQGIQYYNAKTNKFTNYLHKKRGGNSNIKSVEISHLQLFDNKLFIAGESYLEYLDLNDQTFHVVLDTQGAVLTFLSVESLEEIWVGTTKKGLIRYNSITGESKNFMVEDGLSGNTVHYLTKYGNDKLFVTTTNGLSVLDLTTNTFRNYHEKDGLISGDTSPHGEFVFVENKLYIPTKQGVSIVDPEDLPRDTYIPKTTITRIQLINIDNDSGQLLSLHPQKDQNIKLESYNNNLQFDFVSLSFIYPNFSRYKFRLKGWQSDFEKINATKRFARYTNLDPGNYIFEVYSSNSGGLWDPVGTQFSFTILKPWWSTWWARCIFVALLLTAIYGVIRLRLAINVNRERTLRLKVKEKTKQLEGYAEEIAQTSRDLADLNSELELRVEQRTAELQTEISERKAVEKKLYQRAYFDALTSLANRQRVIQIIEDLINRSQKDSEFSFAVMFIDGDRFKQVNDTFGHLFGDELLVQSSQRLLDNLSQSQHAGRLGGDEFTVILENANNQDIIELANRLVKSFKQPFTIENYDVRFEISLGIVLCDNSYSNVQDVLKHADIAMYRAKESGRGTFELFDDKMQRQTLETVELEKELRESIGSDQFSLVYQPLVCLETGVIDGFEALIRWHHPTKGLISPAEFIPLAEEAGLIWDIGVWVLKEACCQLVEWHRLPLEHKPSISVNLSTNQIRKGSFLQHLDNILKQTRADSQFLKLELTESILIENNHELADLYEALRIRKIDLAIDDFGTGYSSLAYLNEIPVQYLKIDRRFVAAIDGNGKEPINHNALKVLEATVALGKGLGKKVTAEGIETQTQLQHLIEFDCDLAQGYYLSKPVDVNEATTLLTSPKSIEEGGSNINKNLYSKHYTTRIECAK